MHHDQYSIFWFKTLCTVLWDKGFLFVHMFNTFRSHKTCNHFCDILSENYTPVNIVKFRCRAKEDRHSIFTIQLLAHLSANATLVWLLLCTVMLHDERLCFVLQDITMAKLNYPSGSSSNLYCPVKMIHHTGINSVPCQRNWVKGSYCKRWYAQFSYMFNNFWLNMFQVLNAVLACLHRNTPHTPLWVDTFLCQCVGAPQTLEMETGPWKPQPCKVGAVGGRCCYGHTPWQHHQAGKRISHCRLF